MQQEEQQMKDPAAVKAELLKTRQADEPLLTEDQFGASIEDVLKVVRSDKMAEWNKLIDDFPEQPGKLYIFFPSSPNNNWGRGEEGAPSFRNLYKALDRYGINRETLVCAVSVPLGVVPCDYFPIKPVTDCPGIDRWFVEKHGWKWCWRAYRDVIGAVARQVARFVHEQKVKRRMVVIVRKNSVIHDVWRTVVQLLGSGYAGFMLDVRACPYPLWSEEAVDFIDTVIKEMAADIEQKLL